VAKFYSARSKTIPPLPWQTFALPFSSFRFKAISAAAAKKKKEINNALTPQ
jgi:hypothetical protein